MIHFLRLFIIVLVLFASYQSNAQVSNFDVEKMDAFFNLIDTNKKGMGSVSIFENGKEVYQKTFGFSDVENKVLSNENTKYRIASISKIFTATVIMKLIEEGKISLNTKLSEFFPEIQRAEQITIKNLLEHKSGIFNYTDEKDIYKWMYKPIHRDSLLNKIFAYKPVFKPGEKVSYSNSNYFLLANIAEISTGKTYEDLVENIICKPCGLIQTGVSKTINPKNNEAHSYIKLKEDWVVAAQTHSTVFYGAGSLKSTPNEINRFIKCLFNNKIVSKQTLSKMTDNPDSKLGLGLHKIHFYKNIAYGHEGFVDGFRSATYYFPSKEYSFTYLTNSEVMPLRNILKGILSISFNKPYQLPDFKIFEVNPKDLDKYLGVYSSEKVPVKITISKDGTTLIGQTTGQPSFNLEAYELHKFKFEPSKLKLEFLPTEKKMILKQMGQEVEFKKE